MTDGTQVTFDNPTIQNDSIGAVALSDVRLIEVRRFSAGKTAALVIGVPVGLATLAIVALLICAADDDCWNVS